MKKTSLLPTELEIILGSLLGDSHLRNNTSTIDFSHSHKQYEYLKWKHDKLNRITTNIWKTIIQNKYIRYDFKTSKKYKLDVKSISLLIWDKRNKKTVTRKWLNLLTPLSLAIWWLDDGSLTIHKGNRVGKLSTHCFSYEEHLIIQKYFEVIWDIKIDIRMEKNKYYFCRLNVTNLKKLITIIYPYVTQIPSMIYKIDFNYKNKKYIGDFEYVYNYIKNCINPRRD